MWVGPDAAQLGPGEGLVLLGVAGLVLVARGSGASAPSSRSLAATLSRGVALHRGGLVTVQATGLAALVARRRAAMGLDAVAT